MASVWVILLDVSGSMNEGFSGAASDDPLAERGRWRTKLEAAKDLVLRQVAASRVQDVAVISFADDARKIFHGARSEFSQAEATIRGLVTEGRRTNLASGLTAVSADEKFESYKALSVLILSDGLSNTGDPVAAAERLITKYPFCRIDTILIDETEDGRRVAESVSTGSVRPAFSVLDLGQALESARASSLRQELAGFATRRLSLQSELALIADVGSPTLLTVTSPLELTAASLRNDIVPTLEGMESLGRAVSDVSGRPYSGTITSISQDSPISISLSGFKEAVDLALEWVIPWRRRNAELLAVQKLRQHELENEKATIQNRQLEVELAASKLALAERMLATFDRDHSMSDRRRQRLLQQFVTGIDQMSKTSIEFKAIGGSSGNDDALTRQ